MKTQTPPPAPELPAMLTLSELIARLFEAKVGFSFSYNPGEDGEKENFRASVNGEKTSGDGAVTTLLSALAKGLQVEEAFTKKGEATLAESRRRLAKVNELLPGLSAHMPAEDGTVCSCGRIHGPDHPLAIIAKLIANGPAPEEGDDEDEDPN